ncbi:MAG TPA: DUF4167 domain-containing protein [Albidovulum sp.]|uniref:DUF4167 domain-containing protein n=1 Tax=Albidovulum sp. TaxID=1872424 RepID=UPI002BB0240C|nr:DUF4167 domain-containing protein [Albidovulum sp.]
MRSSKSRSRSKSNRQRTLGNIVNRVFDSSGPEGKVRGTPQQIIDKYLMLARDAQLSNDRVAEQNFLQHAEHYTRMLGEAQREMQREQETRQQHGQDGGQGGYTGNGNGNGNGGYGQQPSIEDRGERQPERAPDRGPQDRNQDRGQQQNRRREDQRGDRAPDRGGEDYRRAATFGEDRGEDEGPGLVETPEARLAAVPTASMMPDLSQASAEEPGAEPAAQKPAQRRPRKPRAKAEESETPAPAATDEQG